MSWIVQSGLPISAVVFSGGKSYHAAVRFDAPDAATFRTRAQAALDHIARLGLPAPDKCLSDPSRSIRFPNYPRGDAKQELIELAVGAASWDEWEAAHADPLPAPLDLDRLIVADWTQDPDNLLGHRWLCRTRSALFVGSSGIGKSTLILTAAVRWALGRDFHGLAPARPLRILYIQAENDNGDVGEMLQGLVGHAFQADEWDAAKRNMVFLSESGASGERFLERIRRLIAMHRPDLVIADPLLTYVGSDVTKLETVSSFFRNGINQILEQSATRPGMIWVHHTGKPIADAKARQHWTDSDLQYLGIGSSDLTNWARSIMVLQRVKTENDDAPTFCLSAVKRGGRAGLRDYDGLASTRIFLRHSDRGQSWLACPDPNAGGAGNGTAPANRPKKDWSCLQAVLPMSRKDILTWLQREGYKDSSCPPILRRLVASRIIRPDPHIPDHFLPGKNN
jgi:RecA-family ATPase